MKITVGTKNSTQHVSIECATAYSLLRHVRYWIGVKHSTCNKKQNETTVTG